MNSSIYFISSVHEILTSSTHSTYLLPNTHWIASLITNSTNFLVVSLVYSTAEEGHSVAESFSFISSLLTLICRPDNAKQLSETGAALSPLFYHVPFQVFLIILLLTKGTVFLKAPHFLNFITTCPVMLICGPNNANQLSEISAASVPFTIYFYYVSFQVSLITLN